MTGGTALPLRSSPDETFDAGSGIFLDKPCCEAGQESIRRPEGRGHLVTGLHNVPFVSSSQASLLAACVQQSFCLAAALHVHYDLIQGIAIWGLAQTFAHVASVEHAGDLT
jgi:hypothetical protein